MEGRYLLDAAPLDEGIIRTWAFDSDLHLMQQDEDLVLHDWQFSKLLIDLIADPKCPRAEEIFDVWNSFSRSMAIHQVPSDIGALREALGYAATYPDHAGLQQWISELGMILTYVGGIGPVDGERALLMGQFLLKGRTGPSTISVRAETTATYMVEISVIDRPYKEWLSIDKSTGRFSFSRYWPQGAAEPIWFDPHA